MRALSIQRPGKAAVTDIARPNPAPGEVLIRVSTCGVCGTDIHIYRGDYIGTYPIIPGHEFSGIVELAGKGSTRCEPGTKVAVEPNIACHTCEPCLSNRQNFCENWSAVGVTRPGGMAEYVLCPESAVFPIGSLSFETAAFMEPVSCILHGLSKLTIRPGDRVAVIGAGPIGLQVARTIAALGAGTLTLAERNTERLAFAQSSGIGQCAEDARALASDTYDVVIEAAGVPKLMPELLRITRFGGSILLFGVAPKDMPATVEPFTIFRKGLSIHGSYTSVRNSYQALRLLQEGRVAVADLITHRLALEEFEHGVDCLEQGTNGVMKVMMVPEQIN